LLAGATLLKKRLGGRDSSDNCAEADKAWQNSRAKKNLEINLNMEI
jgi:hypothetical protein